VAWSSMTDTMTNIHPYTLEILPPKIEGASYQWAIRKNGKLVQRSDRSLESEAKARSNGMAQIEKLLSGAGDR
jgi:hypothetical protein